MKFYYISMFLFIVNLVGGYFVTIASGMGFTEVAEFGEPSESQLAEAEREMMEAVGESEITEEGVLAQILQGVTGIVSSIINKVFAPLMKFVNWLPVTLILLGTPTGFAYMLGIIFWMIQIIGIAQLLLGRSVKDVE